MYEILQYGSSFFGADTQDSDFDLVLVMTIKSLNILGFNSENARSDFFFKELGNKLSEESIKDLEVVLIPNARVPLIKLKYKESLQVDLSFVMTSKD